MVLFYTFIYRFLNGNIFITIFFKIALYFKLEFYFQWRICGISYGVFLQENDDIAIYLGHRNSQLQFRCNLKYGYIFLQSTKPSISDSYLWQRPSTNVSLFLLLSTNRNTFSQFFFEICSNYIAIHQKHRKDDIYLINWVRGGDLPTTFL